uniref:(Atlantic silverside) hypothetical protein n=1 Tax=Menidia menidia TaxID=238744 RepID=A0A8S4AAX3_9TELE|nr:unnamed protein product [Menidia menidia]
MSRLWRYLAVGLAIAGGLVSAEADQNITAQPGEDVTLKCQDGNEKKIAVLEWSRTDLDPDHVLFFREGLFESKYQHPSFKNRVDLLDSQMKDGDVSLILKNVTINDTGTYECRVMQREVDQGTNNMELICTLHLEVASGSKDGGDEDGRDDDGGDDDGGDEDGGDEDGRDKDGGDEDGRDKDGGTSRKLNIAGHVTDPPQGHRRPGLRSQARFSGVGPPLTVWSRKWLQSGSSWRRLNAERGGLPSHSGGSPSAATARNMAARRRRPAGGERRGFGPAWRRRDARFAVAPEGRRPVACRRRPPTHAGT